MVAKSHSKGTGLLSSLSIPCGVSVRPPAGWAGLAFVLLAGAELGPGVGLFHLHGSPFLPPSPILPSTCPFPLFSVSVSSPIVSLIQLVHLHIPCLNRTRSRGHHNKALNPSAPMPRELSLPARSRPEYPISYAGEKSKTMTVEDTRSRYNFSHKKVRITNTHAVLSETGRSGSPWP